MNFPEGSKITAATEQKLRVVVWIFSAVVLLLVGLMRRPEFKIALPDGVSLGFLPGVHAILNSCVAVCLVLALVAVKRGNIIWHQRFITTAMVLSALFLIGYVSYQLTSQETRYTQTGWIRPVYFTLLGSHIVLAAVSLPFILLAYLSGRADRRQAHRRLVKFVFPMWLYVAITGPVVYLMLY